MTSTAIQCDVMQLRTGSSETVINPEYLRWVGLAVEAGWVGVVVVKEEQDTGSMSTSSTAMWPTPLALLDVPSMKIWEKKCKESHDEASQGFPISHVKRGVYV